MLLIAAQGAMAQNTIDLFTVSGRYGIHQPYNPPPANYVGEDLTKHKAQESALFINLKAPIKFNDKTIWFNNLTYTYSHVNNGLSLPDFMATNVGLNAFIFQTGIIQRLSKNNALQLLYVPRYMTDFLGKNGNEWQHGAIAMFEHRWNPNFMMRFGVMYNQEKSGPLLVPLFDINWQINNRWSVAGLFPIYLKINYKVSERFTAGLSHFGLITSYELHGEGYAGDYMERTSIDLCLFGRYNVAGNWYLEGRLGYALGRNYEQYHSDQQIDMRISIIKIGDNRGEPVNVTFQDGPIAELRLVYSIPIPQ